MFLLLALIVQLVQIIGGKECNALYEDQGNYDYGEDYFSWISVSSLSQCQRQCESKNNCFGITWVKNGNRNCALYDRPGIQSGVARRGQDSYYCYTSVTHAAGGQDTHHGTALAGTSGLDGHSIGGTYSTCSWPDCKARSGQCCEQPLNRRRCPRRC